MEKTNRESFTKSIKLEAIPVEATKKTIIADELMQDDQILDSNAKTISVIIDDLIKSIISNSLQYVMGDFTKMYNLYLSDNSADKKEYLAAQELLKKNIIKTISKNLPEGLSKIMDINSAKILDPVLIHFVKNNSNYSDLDKYNYISIIKSLKGCMPKLNKYTRTRVTALETWVPERVIENFEIFCDNINLLNTFINSPYKEEQTYLEEHPDIYSISMPSYYEYVCCPEDIEQYNRLLHGIISETGVIEDLGYNAFINQLNTNRHTNKEYTGKFYKKLKPLHQQILFPKEKAFSIDQIKDDKELSMLLNEISMKLPKESLFKIITFIRRSNSSDMLVNGKDIHTLSALATNNHNTLVNIVLETELTKATNRNDKKAINNIEKYVAKNTYSLQELSDITNKDLKTVYLDTLIKLHSEISEYSTKLKGFGILDGKAELYKDTRNKNLIKDYLDTLCDFDRYLRMILKNSISVSANVYFYNQFEDLRSIFDGFNTAYNKSRNYLTQNVSDFATEAQICFGNAAKYNAKWLNARKMENGMNSILRMDDKYYFITINPKSSKHSFEIKEPIDKEHSVDLFFQKTFQKAANTFTKRIFKDSGASEFFDHNPLENNFIVSQNMVNPVTVTRKEYAIYRDKLACKPAIKEGLITEDEFKTNVSTLIDLYKNYALNCIAMQEFTFRFKDAKDYADLNDFYTCVDKDLFVPKWLTADRSQIEALINDGTLLAFLITNKNMYKDECTKTTYAQTFLYMMSDDNFDTRNIRMNSSPSLLFRPACLPYHCTHKKGSILVNKKTIDGEFIPRSIYKEIYNFYNGYYDTKNHTATVNDLSVEAQALINNNKIKTRVADYDIIKYKRYMEDKFFISFSYKKNAQINATRNNTITDEVREHIKSFGSNVLVVTRGTTDLLFYTLFDKDGNVIEEKNLNVINDVNYQQKLHSLYYERNNAKSNDWDYTKVSQNYKISYLNFAIAEISKIAIKNNAVIVVEKISDRYKDKMSCFDNQVFNLFENKLETKLLDYYDKHTTYGEEGSLSNPIQLVRTFDRVIHPTQNGILFRINSAHTINMDSKTHFVNLLPLSEQRTIKQKIEFLKLFDNIKLENNLVSFTFDYNKFNLDKLPERCIWTVYGGKPMSVWDIEHKHFEWQNEPFKYVTEAIVEAGLQNRNLALEDLPDNIVKGLFSMLNACLRHVIIRNGKEFEISLYSSPVTNDFKPILSTMNATRNLYKKFKYYLSDDNISNGNFEINWINYAQKDII